jgi:adenosine deaminase CECR1
MAALTKAVSLFLVIVRSLDSQNNFVAGYSVQAGQQQPGLMKEYLSIRDQIFNNEKAKYLGSSNTLDSDETQANNKLMKYKLKELDEAMLTGDFGPARSFYLTKQDIESSGVFNFIKRMPKGAALHTHHISLGSIRWIVANLTYW